MAGDELAVGGVEHCRVELSRAADWAGPDQLGGPDVIRELAAEQLGVPSGQQAFHGLERRGLAKMGAVRGKCLVLRGLPGHLLAGHPQHERTQVLVPEERVVEPAVGIHDLQHVLLCSVRPVELGAVGQRDAGAGQVLVPDMPEIDVIAVPGFRAAAER